jgi:oligopeptide transport system ATP-binding protein
MMWEKILTVNNLNLSFHTYDGEINALRGVNFALEKRDTLAIVGESGSGKSVTAKEIMSLLPKQNTRVNGGEILYEGKDLLKYSNKEMQRIRGSEISMIFQDPMTSLNPTMTVGKQIMEGLKQHERLTKKEALKKAIHLLTLAGIPNAEERIKAYPHQFSGGMRQRVVIAMALACNPKILIADEPTTALDVTIQMQILELMKELQEKTGMGILLITHDLGVVANIAKHVAVMYAGKIVETGTVDEIFYHPKHPYTWGLLSSMPKLHLDRSLPLIPISGMPPDLGHLPMGCSFAARCPHVMKVCHRFDPIPSKVSDTHSVLCWLEDTRAPKVKPPVGGEDDL